MQVYLDPRTVNCRKVIAGLGLMGVDYEVVNVDYFAGGQKEPAYLKINPNASLPTLVDGDFILWESNAILQYAADKAGAASAYPQDLKVRADINRWLLWEASAWFPSCYVYLVENGVKMLMGEEPDQAALEAQDPTFHKLAAILDARLDGQSWLCGPEPTIADISMAAPMHLHAVQKLPLEPHANLRVWMARIEELPCWKSSDVMPLLAPMLGG